jgi:hypothetical protein
MVLLHEMNVPKSMQKFLDIRPAQFKENKEWVTQTAHCYVVTLSSSVLTNHQRIRTHILLLNCKKHGAALDGTVLRQWPLCYTRIGYRRTMVRREFCYLTSAGEWDYTILGGVSCHQPPHETSKLPCDGRCSYVPFYNEGQINLKKGDFDPSEIKIKDVC